MNKIEVVAHTTENSTATKTLSQHIFKPKMCGRYYEEKYEGNISLCGRIGIALEDLKYMHISEIPPEPLDRANGCKNCIRVLDTKTNFELLTPQIINEKR